MRSLILFIFFWQYGGEGVEPLVSEDKVMFGIHGHAKSVLTLLKIRKYFRRTDAKAVAREVLHFDMLLTVLVSQ